MNDDDDPEKEKILNFIPNEKERPGQPQKEKNYACGILISSLWAVVFVCLVILAFIKIEIMNDIPYERVTSEMPFYFKNTPYQCSRIKGAILE